MLASTILLLILLSAIFKNVVERFSDIGFQIYLELGRAQFSVHATMTLNADDKN
jgi:hypothetical protein